MFRMEEGLALFPECMAEERVHNPESSQASRSFTFVA